MLTVKLKMEDKSVEDICDFLESKGYHQSVIEAFRGKATSCGKHFIETFAFADEEFDGPAIAAGLASGSSADWLKDAVPKSGLRIKIHQCLKQLHMSSQEIQVSR